MLEGRYEPFGKQRYWLGPSRNHLLQRHPVLAPALLFASSTACYLLSFFADSLFPVLSLLRFPSGLFCVVLATVLGIAGILAGIISSIEQFDRRALSGALLPKPEEQSYAHRN